MIKLVNLSMFATLSSLLRKPRFKHPSQYSDLLLKPIRKIKDNFIIQVDDYKIGLEVAFGLQTQTVA